MTEKLKVSREVADAIETIGRDRNVMGRSVNAQLQFHAERSWKSVEREPLNALTLEEFATALIVGYEVEKTPHELIQKAYKKSNVKRGVSVGLNDMILVGAENGFMNGVEFTLNTLGITVKGVNDK